MTEFFINFISSNTFETIANICLVVLMINALILMGVMCYMALGSEEDSRCSTLQKILIHIFVWTTLLAIVTVSVLVLTKILVSLFLM